MLYLWAHNVQEEAILLAQEEDLLLVQEEDLVLIQEEYQKIFFLYKKNVQEEDLHLV